MSEREKARALVEEVHDALCGETDDHNAWMDLYTDKIEALLRSAREEERRRCADLARAMYPSIELAHSIATAIESASEKAGDRDRPE